MKGLSSPKALAVLIATVLMLVAPSAWASFQVPPRPDGPVADTADVLTPAQEQVLRDKLVALQKDTGVSLVVATIPSLEGSDIKEAGYEIASTWGIGSKDTHKGALFLISVAEARKAGPGAKGCGCIRIEVGSYLEGDLTDRETKNVLKKAGPIVVTGDFNQAANVAVDGIAGLLAVQSETAQDTRSTATTKSEDTSAGWIVGIFGALFGVGFLAWVFRPRPTSRSYSSDDPPYVPPRTPSHTRRSYSPPSRSSTRPRAPAPPPRTSSDDDDDDDGMLAAAAILTSMASSSSRRSSYDDDDDDSFGGFGGGGGSSFFDDGDFGGGGSDW